MRLISEVLPVAKSPYGLQEGQGTWNGSSTSHAYACEASCPHILLWAPLCVHEAQVKGMHWLQVSYFNSWRLLRTYILPVTPLGVFKHGLNKGDVKKNLERETNCIVMRWLETSNPPVARAVAEVLIRSPQ